MVDPYALTWQHWKVWSCPNTVDLSDPMDHPVIWLVDVGEHLPVCTTCGTIGPWFDDSGREVVAMS